MENLYCKNNLISAENVSYTVDMLRLRTNLTYSEFSKIEFYIQTVIIEKYSVLSYHSTDISSFKNNYVIKFSETSSFWLGFIHNSEILNKNISSDKVDYNFTIEFNPNKVDYKKISFILSQSKSWVIKSIDLAMDIPINIKDLFLFDKKRKRQISIYSKSIDDKTIYIGKSNNRIKIYNKKLESNLNRELTRVEISSKISLKIEDIDYYKYEVELPEIFLNEYIYSLSDLDNQKKDQTLYALLYALQMGYDFNDLSRKYKDKIKNMLRGGYQIKFSNEACTKVIKKLIKNIFKEYIY